LVCTLAVSVSTPSRSNKQARTFSGRPSTADPHFLEYSDVKFYDVKFYTALFGALR
jgi:hypothetical protein